MQEIAPLYIQYIQLATLRAPTSVAEETAECQIAPRTVQSTRRLRVGLHQPRSYALTLSSQCSHILNLSIQTWEGGEERV